MEDGRSTFRVMHACRARRIDGPNFLRILESWNLWSLQDSITATNYSTKLLKAFRTEYTELGHIYPLEIQHTFHENELR
jgi:hypothetical protein